MPRSQEISVRMKTGSYVGDGALWKFIELGFEYKYLRLWWEPLHATNGMCYEVINDWGDICYYNHASGSSMAAYANLIKPNDFGFYVSDQGSDLPPNTTGKRYFYMALG